MTPAVIVTDIHGTITHSNAGTEELFGHRAADTLGRPVDLLVPAHPHEAHSTGFHRVSPC